MRSAGSREECQKLAECQEGEDAALQIGGALLQTFFSLGCSLVQGGGGCQQAGGVQ